MGKGFIAGGGPGGLYNLKVVWDRKRALARIKTIDASIAALNTTIITLGNELAAQRGIYALAKSTSPAKPFTELATMATAINTKQAKLDLNLVLRSSYMATRSNLQSIHVDPDASAWCADLTENLQGFVGTIEPNGEPSACIILPGYLTKARYDQSRDGQIQPIMSNTPEGTFINKALMPGWQKWKPTFRIGTLTSIDREADTCSLTLDLVNSRERPQGKSLDINQGRELSSVPMLYMTCNSGAFEVGDRVVVKFVGQNFNTPQVIGFESNPKSCELGYAVVTISAAQEEDDPNDPINMRVISRSRIILWDIAKKRMVDIPGITFPCSPTNPTWVAWIADHAAISTALFSAEDRGTGYMGRGGFSGVGALPDETLPELELPEDTVATVMSDGYWFDWHPGYPDSPIWMTTVARIDFTVACAKPWLTDFPGGTPYGAPWYGQLLRSLIPYAPLPYSAFRTSVIGDFTQTGEGLDYYPPDGVEANGFFTVHSPYGVLATYEEHYSYVGRSYSGPWPMRRAPQPEWVEGAENSICERLCVNQAYCGVKSIGNIVNIFLHQYRNYSMVYDGPGPYYAEFYPTDTLIFDHEAQPAGNRIVNIHAQAKSFVSGTEGKNFVVAGRSTEFETALLAAVNTLYDGLDLDDAENIWQITVTSDII